MTHKSDFYSEFDIKDKVLHFVYVEKERDRDRPPESEDMDYIKNLFLCNISIRFVLPY